MLVTQWRIEIRRERSISIRESCFTRRNRRRKKMRQKTRHGCESKRDCRRSRQRPSSDITLYAPNQVSIYQATRLSAYFFQDIVAPEVVLTIQLSHPRLVVGKRTEQCVENTVHPSGRRAFQLTEPMNFVHYMKRHFSIHSIIGSL